MEIKNEQDLKRVMEKLAGEAIKKATARILQKLKEQIQKDVYTEPNLWYERTGDFERAWLWSDVEKKVNSLVTELSYDPRNMRYIPKDWIHGNPGRSAVDNLADILNLAFNNYKDGYTSNLMFGNKHFSHFRRPYWENFIKNMFSNGELEKILSEEFGRVGFVKI
jgi:predicted Holliday junction resolvase-like endonuclease